jgi:hypothetical protein
METARISFKAVIEEDINKYLLPPSEAERMKAIRRNYKK